MTRINGTTPPPVPPAVTSPPASGRDGRSSRPVTGGAAGRPDTGQAAPSRRAASAGRVAGGAAGLVSAALALGAGELVAGLAPSLRSPVEAVATEVIDRAPRPVERFAIETFGTNDKLALIVGTLAITAVLGVVFGGVARRRPLAGTAGFAFFALLGVLASIGAPRAGALAPLPSLAAGVAGAATLRLLVPPAGGPVALPPSPLTRGGMGSRRAFLGATAAVAAGAAMMAAGGRALKGRFSAAESRANVTLPRPARALPPVPAGVEAGVDGIAPFVTPNRDFYRIDTALIVPQVRAEDWTLRVTGMVDRPFELSYPELSELDIVEADITMTCVSNPVGGDLVGHARWLGVLTRDLLDRAGVRRGADQVVGRSVDGYTCGFPLSAVYDRPALVAIGMNGEPLPLRHGFPARLVTPGIYGYVGATKWLTEIEVTTFDAFDQYWVPRGYAAEAPIKTMTRIDTPRSFATVPAGRVVVGGVAWAQTRGIETVEISIDGAEFEPVQLADELTAESWRQWRYEWDATPGRHDLVVRAVDGTGVTQTEERAEVVPDGASGRMSLVVTVSDGEAAT
ncbi:MAG TPA: molybdopterin-dependent oxidoreductase [Acidimicrobiales bacterium]|nr:molybdopterin-dependent oxidoreductase [Acidimicrobiales bacterium]